MAFFRHKQRFNTEDTKVKTPYGHEISSIGKPVCGELAYEYPVFEGYLFIPDAQKMDIQFILKRNYIFINHIEVAGRLKKKFLDEFPQCADEINLKTKLIKEW